VSAGCCRARSGCRTCSFVLGRVACIHRIGGPAWPLCGVASQGIRLAVTRLGVEHLFMARVVGICNLDLRDASTRNFDSDLRRVNFNLRQLVLGILTALAVGSLIAAIPYGLLSEPDMSVRSPGGGFAWFVDQSTSLLPAATVFSIPLIAYKIGILRGRYGSALRCCAGCLGRGERSRPMECGAELLRRVTRRRSSCLRRRTD